MVLSRLLSRHPWTFRFAQPPCATVSPAAQDGSRHLVKRAEDVFQIANCMRKDKRDVDTNSGWVRAKR